MAFTGNVNLLLDALERMPAADTLVVSYAIAISAWATGHLCMLRVALWASHATKLDATRGWFVAMNGGYIAAVIALETRVRLYPCPHIDEICRVASTVLAFWPDISHVHR